VNADVTIDLGAIVRNAQALAELVAPAQLAPVVKANAYGHGLAAVAQALAPHVDRLCVYELDEALARRRYEHRHPRARTDRRAGSSRRARG
jgi:alanine racemase